MDGDRNAWYTPVSYIRAVHATMGGIDLDPASCAEANRIVRATCYYTSEQNGLILPWYERVYLNPPYSAEDSVRGIVGGKKEGPTKLFLARLWHFVATGDVTEAIVCVNADLCRQWFAPLWHYPICFTSKPVLFGRPGKKSEHHFFSTAFAYIGPHRERFVEAFTKFGPIVTQVIPRRTRMTQPDLWEAV